MEIIKGIKMETRNGIHTEIGNGMYMGIRKVIYDQNQNLHGIRNEIQLKIRMECTEHGNQKRNPNEIQ